MDDDHSEDLRDSMAASPRGSKETCTQGTKSGQPQESMPEQSETVALTQAQRDIPARSRYSFYLDKSLIGRLDKLYRAAAYRRYPSRLTKSAFLSEVLKFGVAALSTDELRAAASKARTESALEPSTRVRGKRANQSMRSTHSLYVDREVVDTVDNGYRTMAHILYPLELRKSLFLECVLDHALSYIETDFELLYPPANRTSPAESDQSDSA